MYYQVPDGSVNSQPIIGSRSFKVGIALISASCLVFLFIVATPFSSPVVKGSTAAESISLASMPSTVRFPQIAKSVRPAPGFLRSPHIDNRRSSVVSKGMGSVETSEPAPTAAKMTPRRSMLTNIAAAVAAPFLLSDPSWAATDTSSVATKDLPAKMKMLQTIGSWDTNKDGRINREEFDKGMHDWVPHELTPGQLDNAWARIQKKEINLRANDPSYAGNTLTEAQKQMPRPGQPIELPINRVESKIPKTDGTYYKYPSPQQAYNAMLRKGKDPDIYRAKDFVETHNEMNDRGWDQVLKYESVTHPECPAKEVKLRKFNGDYAGRVSGSFDRHHWIVNRCGKEEMTYVLDYFDTKKYDEVTMPYSNDDIEIRVQPDPEDPMAKDDVLKFKKAMGRTFTSTADIK